MGDRAATQGPGPEGPWRIERYGEVDSTNRRVMDRVHAGEPDGLVVVADFQTHGRGRLGREWVAPPGSSLLASVLLGSDPALDLPAERLHVLTMAASVALAEAVDALGGVPVRLKWPNDLVVDDRKLAGVLCEVVWSAEHVDDEADRRVETVVVGVGCNLSWDHVPPELVGRATACNLESDVVVERDALLDSFLSRLGVHRAAVGSGPGSIAAAYRSRLSTLGRDVRVELADRVVEGTATDLDDAGRLVVTPADGGPVTITAGDVTHLR